MHGALRYQLRGHEVGDEALELTFEVVVLEVYQGRLNIFIILLVQGVLLNKNVLNTLRGRVSRPPVLLQHVLHEVNSLHTFMPQPVVLKVETHLLYSEEDCLVILPIKRHLMCEQAEQDDTGAPDIALDVVLAIYDLGCDVVR